MAIHIQYNFRWMHRQVDIDTDLDIYAQLHIEYRDSYIQREKESYNTNIRHFIHTHTHTHTHKYINTYINTSIKYISNLLCDYIYLWIYYIYKYIYIYIYI